MSDDVEFESESTAPIWAFGDLMSVLLGAFVLILVGVIGVQLQLSHKLELAEKQRQAELQRRTTLEKALATPLAQGRVTLVNGRIGIRGPNERWAIEVWGQNLFNTNYAQVAFNSPFQEGGTGVPPFAAGLNATPFIDPQYPGGRQIFSQFLAEPRTYGVTLRGRF